jgi:hypothetical protein
MQATENRATYGRANGKSKCQKTSSKKYLRPASASMADFSSRTALGVSPAMKKKENYVVSVLF